jgi:hypothetical protein
VTDLRKQHRNAFRDKPSPSSDRASFHRTTFSNWPASQKHSF